MPITVNRALVRRSKETSVPPTGLTMQAPISVVQNGKVSDINNHRIPVEIPARMK
jgi:hypothetical protein